MAMQFAMKYKEPELIVPSKPTQQEIKQLSDLDKQKGLRIQIPMIMFYEHNPRMDTNDPVGLIKYGVAAALVYYYPFAGRLIEGPDQNGLMVNCTAEGVLFREAMAEIKLDQLRGFIKPPFVYSEQFLLDGSTATAMLGTPLMLIQNYKQRRDYGNTLVLPVAVSKVKTLCNNALGYAVELVKKAKAQVNEDFINSSIDSISMHKTSGISTSLKNLVVVDISRSGIDEVDFGWGKPIYGGTMDGGPYPNHSIYARFRNNLEEDGVVVPICLPLKAMEKFQEIVDKLSEEPMEYCYRAKLSRL